MTLETPHDGEYSGDQPARPEQRLRALARYLRAFERGDLEIVAEILRAAGDDPALERLILALHATDEAGSDAATSDATLAQARAFVMDMQGAHAADTSANAAPLAPQPPAALNGAHAHANASTQPTRQPTWRSPARRRTGGEQHMRQDVDTVPIPEQRTPPEPDVADDARLATTSASLRAPGATPTHHAARPSRQRIVQPLMQALAAVVILGALLGGFYSLFAMRHGQGSLGGIGSQPGVTGLVSTATPIADASQVIVTGTRDGAVVALNPTSGQVFWRYNFGGRYPITGIFIQQGAVYVISAFDADNTTWLFALRLRDGHALWREQVGYAAAYPSYYQVDSGILYVTVGLDAPGVSIQGVGVVAVRLRDGAKLWHTTQSTLAYVADGIVYVSANNTNASDVLPLYAVQGTTGKRIWTFLAPTGDAFQVATVYQGEVYLYGGAVVDSTGLAEFVVLDEHTGVILRHLPAPSLVGVSEFYPGRGGALYLLEDTHLYALALPSGNRLWDAPLTGAESVAQALAVTDSAIYLLSFPKYNHLVVTALSAASGHLLWNTDTGPVRQYSVYNSGGVSIGGGFYEAQGITQIGDDVFVAGTPGLITLRASDGHIVRRDLPHDILIVVAQPTP